MRKFAELVETLAATSSLSRGRVAIAVGLLAGLSLIGCKSEPKPDPEPAPAMEASHMPPGLEALQPGVSTRAEVMALLGDAEPGAASAVVVDGAGAPKTATQVAVWRSEAWFAAHPDGDPSASLLDTSFSDYDTIIVRFGEVDGTERMMELEGETTSVIGICERVDALDASDEATTCTDGFEPSPNERCAAVDGRNVRVLCVAEDDPETEVDPGIRTVSPDRGERFVYRISE